MALPSGTLSQTLKISPRKSVVVSAKLVDRQACWPHLRRSTRPGCLIHVRWIKCCSSISSVCCGFFTTYAVNSSGLVWGSKSNFVHFSFKIWHLVVTIFCDFSENQLTKFLVFSPLSHTGMIFLWKEVTVWFLLVQRSAGMSYRLIPSHLEPWLEATNINGMLIVVKVLGSIFSRSLLLARGTVCLWVIILRVYTELNIVARTESRLQ